MYFQITYFFSDCVLPARSHDVLPLLIPNFFLTLTEGEVRPGVEGSAAEAVESLGGVAARGDAEADRFL